MAKGKDPNIIEFDVWSLLCLVCNEDLAVDGKRPGHLALTNHFATHDINFRRCDPMVDGYDHQETDNPDGTRTCISGSLYATEDGKGEPMFYAVRYFGTERLQDGR